MNNKEVSQSGAPDPLLHKGWQRCCSAPILEGYPHLHFAGCPESCGASGKHGPHANVVELETVYVGGDEPCNPGGLP